jgi:hypothetical protein
MEARINMLLRNTLTTLLGIGSLLLVADSCAASPLPAGRPLRDRAAGYEVTVLVDGVPAQSYYHAGESYVLGQLGSRYTLRVSNHTGRRMEAVVSVDGRDAIDGRPADFRNKRGYLVPPWGSVDIEGWRISRAQAAAFRFSSVPDSYAARTGSARDVGVIGVAVFPERHVPRPVYRPRPYDVSPPPYSWDDHYRRERSYDRGSDEAESGAPSAGRSATPDASPPPAPSNADKSAGKAYSEAQPRGPSSSRPGLGTEYGEAVSSRVYEVNFVRANASNPTAVLGVRYNDRNGLVAMGIPVDSYYDQTCGSYEGYDDSDLRRTAEPFPVADRRFAAPPPGWHRPCGWR